MGKSLNKKNKTAGRFAHRRRIDDEISVVPKDDIGKQIVFEDSDGNKVEGELLCLNSDYMAVGNKDDGTVNIYPTAKYEVKESDEPSMSHIFVYFNEIEKANKLMSDDNDNGESNWITAVNNYIELIEETGLVTDYLMKTLCETLSSVLKYYKDDTPKDSEIENSIQKKVNVYDRVEKLLQQETVRWSNLSIKRMYASIKYMSNLKFDMVSTQLFMAFENKVAEDLKVNADEIRDLTCFNDIVINDECKWWKECLMIVSVRGCSSSELRNKAISIVKRWDCKDANSEKSDNPTDSTPYYKALEDTRQKLLEYDMESNQVDSQIIKIFKVSLNHAANLESNCNIESKRLYKQSNEYCNGARKMYLNLFKRLDVFYGVDRDKIDNKTYKMYVESYWELVKGLFLVSANKFKIYEKYRMGRSDKPNEEKKQKKQEYVDIIRDAISNGSNSKNKLSYENYTLKNSFEGLMDIDSCPGNKLLWLGKAWKELSLIEILGETKDKIRPYLEKKIKESIDSDIDKSHKATETFEILQCLVLMQHYQDNWNDYTDWISTVFVKAIDKKAEAAGDKVKESIIRILARDHTVFRRYLIRARWHKHKAFMSWFAKTLDECKYIDNVRDTGMANLYLFVAINGVRLNDKLDACKNSMRFIKKEYGGKDSVLYAKLELIKNNIEKYMKRNTFSDSEMSSLDDLRNIHYPETTAKIWALFSYDYGFKRLTHGGFEPDEEVHTFPERIEKMKGLLGILRNVKKEQDNTFNVPEWLIGQISAYLTGEFNEQKRNWTDRDGKEVDVNMTTDYWKRWMNDNPTDNPFRKEDFYETVVFQKSVKLINEDDLIDIVKNLCEKYNEAAITGKFANIKLKNMDWSESFNCNVANLIKIIDRFITTSIAVTSPDDVCLLNFGFEEDSYDDKRIFTIRMTRCQDDISVDNFGRKIEQVESHLKGDIGEMAKLSAGYNNIAVIVRNDKEESKEYAILGDKHCEFSDIPCGFTVLLTFYCVDGDITNWVKSLSPV